MIIVEVLGPWWDIEATATDEETGGTHTYHDQRRCPQFLHDITPSIAWQDVTAQLAEHIPPEPSVCVWRVWCDATTVSKFEAHESYAVLREEVVDGQFQVPTGW